MARRTWTQRLSLSPPASHPPCSPEVPSIWLPFCHPGCSTLHCVTPTMHLGPPGPERGGRGRTQPTCVPDLGCQAPSLLPHSLHSWPRPSTGTPWLRPLARSLGPDRVPCMAPMWGQYPTPNRVGVWALTTPQYCFSSLPRCPGGHCPPISQRRKRMSHPLPLQSPALDPPTTVDHTPTK